MSVESFWQLVESCRLRSSDMQSFNQLLEEALTSLPDADLCDFHRHVWKLVNELNHGRAMKGNYALNDILEERIDVRLGGDQGECFGGWVIAQGELFCKGLLTQPSLIEKHLPSMDDVWEGESVIFAASRVYRQRTNDEGDIYDLLDAR